MRFLDLVLGAYFVTWLTLGGCTAVPKGSSTATGDATQDKAATAEAGSTQDQPQDADKPDGSGDGKQAKASDEDDGDEKAKRKKEKEEKKKKERKSKIEKYEDTIEELTETSGFFKLFHDEEKLLLELDKESFNRDFLYAGALNSGVGSGGLYRGAMLWDNDLVLHFEKRNDKKIVLVAENTRYLEAGDSLEQKRLDESTSHSIIRAFDMAAEHPDKELYLIDLGGWLLGDNLELGKRMHPGKYKVAKDLSLITKVVAFPRNVELDVDLVMTGSRDGGNLTMADARGMRLMVHHSFCALPSDGFKSRLFDQRVGYFTTERKDLFDIESDDPVQRSINRWRLQKKDPTADVSDPVQPIVYWIENTTPKKWRAAVKRGIEAWEPAYRKAGFSNGIVAKQMPEDADWDPADIRYSVVRWSSDENVGFAIGPSRVDPRTGEIFDADITLQESFLWSYGQRFETYIADLATMSKEQIRSEILASLKPERPSDPDALVRCQLAGPEMQDQVARAVAAATFLDSDFDRDAFLEAMLVELVAHEVGHTLGLRHNFKSSTWLTMDQVRNAAETSRRGLVGSVMDYNPIVIAAPGKKQGEYFPSVTGPYDRWAIEYGYTEFGGNEKAGLAAIASRSHEPGLDYGTDEDTFLGDALTRTWDMGSNPIEFATEQVALAEEGFRKLVDKGAEKGEGYHKFARWYGMFASMYSNASRGVRGLLGGYTMNRDVVGQEGGRPPLTSVDTAMQRQALDFLCEKGLKWTGGIPDEQRLLLANKKYGSWGSWFDPWSFDPIPRIVNLQRFSLLVSLVNVPLYERLGNQARLGIPGALGLHAVADKVFETVWPKVPDEHDRWTQADFVRLVMSALDNDTTPDVTALFDSSLRKAHRRCATYAQSDVPEIQAHGKWLIGRIERFRNRQMAELY